MSGLINLPGARSGIINTNNRIRQNPPLFFSAYITGNEEMRHGTWEELGGSTSGRNVTWAIQPSTSVAGSTNANPFSKFDTATGRFTPGISGFYFFTYFLHFSEDIGDTKLIQCLCSRNGYQAPTSSVSGTDANKESAVCFTRQQNATGDNTGVTGSGCISLDTDDYVSMWIVQNHGDGRRLNSGRFSGYYIGENI